MTDEHKLLKHGLKLFRDLADDQCGNTEDTPCDDTRPCYICPYHRWVKEVRQLLKGVAK